MNKFFKDFTPCVGLLYFIFLVNAVTIVIKEYAKDRRVLETAKGLGWAIAICVNDLL